MDPTKKASAWSAIKTVVSKICLKVQEISDSTKIFNGVRLIYAFDRSIKINLKPVNTKNTPLVALHIGKRRDLSLTPTRFNPDTT